MKSAKGKGQYFWKLTPQGLEQHVLTFVLMSFGWRLHSAGGTNVNEQDLYCGHRQWHAEQLCK
eukprot:1669700-Amphidinium_carterae.1